MCFGGSPVSSILDELYGDLWFTDVLGGDVVYRGGFRLPRKGFGGAPSPGGSHGMSAEAAAASTPPRAPRPGTVGGTRPEVDQYQYQHAVDVKLPTLAHTPSAHV